MQLQILPVFAVYPSTDRLRFISNRLTSNAIGKITAARIPLLRLSPYTPETKPASVGPEEQPRSPASASRANRAVPPCRMEATAILKVPGHMIPTERPQSAQPISHAPAAWMPGTRSCPQTLPTKDPPEAVSQN